MKTINKYFLLIGLLMLAACDEGFDELNTNPIDFTEVDIDPAFQLNSAIIGSTPVYGNLSYETTIVRHMITPFSGVGAGANFNVINQGRTATNWDRFYPSVVRNAVDILQRVDVAERKNLYQMTRIWKAFAFIVLTDTYGDIPYSEAGLAYREGAAFPVYDTQESIYTDILKELDEASAALDASAPIEASDILYNGDITQWKRLGYSLLLRAAMRLSKVNPTLAQQYVAKAVAGGVMQSNDDNAYVRHDNNYRDPIGNDLNGGQSHFYYLDEEFVNYLQSTNDPRLEAIAVRYVGAGSSGDQVEANASTDPADQIGMPQGYDNTSIDPVAQTAGLASLYDYSQVDRTRMANPESPSFMVTYAQTQLLLAEAAFRTWTTGDPASFYEGGIRAHMEQCAVWPGDTDIDPADIDSYILANPLATGQELEQINNQYWVASFLNGPESWANFRRSGFPTAPVVTPNPYPGNDLVAEEFIRRLTYPNSESINETNRSAAVQRQGPDNLDTRVWWDN